MEFRNHYFNIDPKKIAFLKFIIEGYDGLATITTVDRKLGRIKLVSPSTRTEELHDLLQDLAVNCKLTEINNHSAK